MPHDANTAWEPYIGQYAVFGELGRGGMGVVYAARHPKLNRPFAIKVLHGHFAATPQAAERLRLEADVASRLDHENIVPIYEVGEHHGQPFLAMGLVEGESLAEVIAASGAMEPRAGAWLVAKIARAVQHAHDRGVLHRDLKPANILLDAQGAPHLSDFGLAKCLDHDSGLSLSGAFLGTPAYASPEQAVGKSRLLTTATDIYSLGAILYAVLTGRAPFSGETPSEIIEQVKTRAPAALRTLRPQIPPDLETICFKCLEKEPGRRYASAGGLAEDLERFLTTRPIQARRVSALERLWLWARREPKLAMLAGLCCGVLLVASAAFLVSYQRTAKARALREAHIARLGPRRKGWVSAHSTRLERIRRSENDIEVLNEAAVAFAGLELKLAATWTNWPGSSVAFGSNGQVLFGGLVADKDRVGDEPKPAHLYTPGSNELEALLPGDGPVGFDAANRPVQFVFVGEGRFVLRDMRSGKVFREFSLPGEPNTGYDEHPVLAMAPGISKVAAAVRAEGGGRFMVWDAATGHSLSAGDELITAMTFAPDGKSFATGHPNGRVTVQSADGQVMATLGAHRAPITCLAFGFDPILSATRTEAFHPWLLAVGDVAAAVTIYRVASSNVISSCKGSYIEVRGLAFRPDGATLAGLDVGRLCVWDVAAGGDPLVSIGNGPGRAVAFSPDGSRLAVAARRGWDTPSITLWDLQEGRGVQTLHGLASRAELVWWSPDGSRLAALGGDWELDIWKMPEGRLTHKVELPLGDEVDNATVAFHPNGRQMAFASGKEACLLDLEKLVIKRRWSFPLGWADSLRFEGNHLFFLHSEKEGRRQPRMWTLRDLLATNWSEPICEQTDTNWVTWETALPRTGNLFLTTGGPRNSKLDSALLAIEIPTGRELWRLRSTRYINNIQFTMDPTDQLLAYTPLHDSDLSRLYRLPGGELVQDLAMLPSAISPGGQWFAGGEGVNGWEIYRPGRHTRAMALGTDFERTYAPKFSPDGSRLAMPSAKGWVLVADLPRVEKQLRALGWSPQ